MNLDDLQITQPIEFNKGKLPYLLSNPKVPHVLWVAMYHSDEVISFFYNSLTKESTDVSKLEDLLVVNMIRRELMLIKWKEVTFPSIRIIMPNGDYKDL